MEAFAGTGTKGFSSKFPASTGVPVTATSYSIDWRGKRVSKAGEYVSSITRNVPTASIAQKICTKALRSDSRVGGGESRRRPP
jgi:hypothetical protein